MAKNLKIVVERKVIDDTYYADKYLWSVVDEENKVYKSGEANTRDDAFITARKALKKMSGKPD